MPNTPGGDPRKPPSLEKRLPLALALMLLVLVVSQYVLKPPPGPKPVKPVNEHAAAQLAAPAPAPSRAITKSAAKAVAPVAASGAQIQAASEITTDVDTDLYHIVFSNRGAVIKTWILKRYTDEMGKPLNLTNSSAKEVPAQFSIQIDGA
ncbi:MAG: hypothetical protein ACRD4O_20020, partial [Bryobacteraceae bacterium]